MPSGPSLIATARNDSLKGSAGGQPRSLDRNERTSAHDGETAVAVSPEVFELRQKRSICLCLLHRTHLRSVCRVIEPAASKREVSTPWSSA